MNILIPGMLKDSQSGLIGVEFYNLSLNDIMIAGPRLQDDISCILLRGRFHMYVIATNIEQIYRQILISPDHRKYQRIFWKDNPAEKVSCYELSTVTYGKTSAPYLAMKALQQLAKDGSEKFPEAAKSCLQGFYADDFLSGSDTIEQCKQLQEDMLEHLDFGGMILR